jgi:hypothetical protein
MKKVLIILGILFVLAIAVAAALIGFAAYNGTKLDASSKEYVDQAAPSIISTWSVAELLDRASPELKAIVTKEQMQQLFNKLSELGKLKEYQGSKGDSFMSYTTQNGKQITAKYRAKALFKNGEAEILIQLIEHDGKWQIINFHVNSPIFLK